MQFSDTFSTTSLCCPAHVSLLRGQYVHNHEVLSNGGPQGGFPKFYQTGFEASTVATWLQDKGNRTGMLGKYLNGYPFDPSGENPPDYRAPRRTYLYPPGLERLVRLFRRTARRGQCPLTDVRLQRQRQWARGPLRSLGKRLSGRCAKRTRRPLYPSEPGQTFFSLSRPDDASPACCCRAPTPEYFPGYASAAPPSFNEEDISDKPRWVRITPRLRESELAQLDDTYRQEAEMMLAVDQMPANILETLRHVGQLQNTYIIFSADQGFHMGEYRLARMKLTPYTGSTQIPIIVRGPGVPARTTLDGLALNTDLVPTIADIAGVTPPSFVDGRSLKPL